MEVVVFGIIITSLLLMFIYFYKNPLFFRVRVYIDGMYLEEFAKGSINCDRICDLYESEYDAYCEVDRIGEKTYESGIKKKKDSMMSKTVLTKSEDSLVCANFEQKCNDICDSCKVIYNR